METPEFALLRTFRTLFEGTRYKHRDSSLGDFVAGQLYEDLVSLNKSPTLVRRVQANECVVNLANRTVGKPSRRGDGTFGELVPTVVAITEKGLFVARGEIANIQIGAETKILAKAMIKQIDRVIGDLIRQAEEFRKTGGKPICVAFVGINHAESYTSYEGERPWPTDGRRYKHPRRKPLSPRGVCVRGPCLRSTNFFSSVSAPPISHHTRSSGSTIPPPQNNTPPSSFASPACTTSALGARLPASPN